MINSSDWNVMYSVGDVYDPGAKTDGLVATDVEITGEGTYTVSLDFTGVPGGYATVWHSPHWLSATVSFSIPAIR